MTLTFKPSFFILSYRIIKKADLSALHLLPWKDSNPHRRNQNPTCYHYTTRQFKNIFAKVEKIIYNCAKFIVISFYDIIFAIKILVMIIASQKRKENIAEYLLYMWQIEDIIRANNMNLDKIEQNIISKYNLPIEDHNKMVEWYESLIDMMRREGVVVSGHLQLNKNVIIQLNDLHNALLKDARFSDYVAEFYKTLPYIVELRAKAKNNKVGEIETCFTALYGYLLLKLQKKELTNDTQNALKQISQFISILAHYYKLDFEDKLFSND